MTHRIVKILPVLLASFLVSAAALADSYFVEDATGNGVGESDLQSTTQLIRNELETLGQQVASDANATELSLKPKLLRLGQAFIVQLEKKNHGKLVFSTQLKAEKSEELDKVTKRLVEAVLSGKPASSDAKVGEITQNEEHEGTQRKPSRHVHYLGFGGALFSQMNASNIGYSFGGAYGWDVNDAIIKIQSDLSLSGSALFFNVGLEGMIFFSSSDVAPYFSVAFGFGLARSAQSSTSDSETVVGFDAGAGGGVLLLRTSNISIDLGLRINLLLATNNLGNPIASTLRVGLYF